MSTLHMMSSISFLRDFRALSAAPTKLYGNPTTRCPRHPSIATGLRKTKCPFQSCSASSNIGLEQISLGKTDTELPSEIQTNGEAQSNKGFLFSSHGWAAFRVDHEDLDMLKQFSHVQAEAFHVPFAIFDDFFFSIFEGEVLSSLLHKIRHASPKRFACLVAVPEQLQGEQNNVVGVVDAAAMADQHVLRCLPGVDEYFYISGMAVDSNHRASGDCFGRYRDIAPLLASVRQGDDCRLVHFRAGCYRLVCVRGNVWVLQTGSRNLLALLQTGLR
ncbi:hypothetical protein L7F22_044614 [Adiantum nelumboides]|nr:hypothetical protein [Adiantum nelumboides]